MRRDRKTSRLARYGKAIIASRILRDLANDEVRRLRLMAKRKHFFKGELIFEPDHVPAEVMVLKSGQAELVAGKRMETIRAAARGEVIGLTEAITGTKSCLGLRASTDCDLVAVSSPELEEFLRKAPEACYRSAEAVAISLQAAMDELGKSLDKDV
jgi:CRP-like cAMP-binding protein